MLLVKDLLLSALYFRFLSSFRSTKFITAKAPPRKGLVGKCSPEDSLLISSLAYNHFQFRFSGAWFISYRAIPADSWLIKWQNNSVQAQFSLKLVPIEEIFCDCQTSL